MKKKNTIPSGFDDILGNIYSNAEEGGGVTIIDDQPNVPLVEEEEIIEPPVKDPEDGKNSGSDDPNAHEDNTDVPPVIENPEPPVETPPVEEPTTEEDPTDADLIEAQ